MTHSEDGMAARRVWFRLARLNSQARSVLAAELAGIELSVPQCDVLTTLTEKEGVSQQELAERLYVTKGNISGLLDRLERLGLVERRATPGDKRQYAILLTSAGRTKAQAAIDAQLAIIAQSFGRLSDANLAKFEELIVEVRDRLRAIGPAEGEAGERDAAE